MNILLINRPVPTATIVAELSGSDTATAVGLTTRAHAPVLALCRRLLAAGFDPNTPLKVYRRSVLCLHIRSLGEAAALEVRPSGTGAPTFVRRETVRAGPPVAFQQPPAPFPSERPSERLP
jgi:Fe2+ transport system protein FeoA